jgi:hypothetical protein
MSNSNNGTASVNSNDPLNMDFSFNKKIHLYLYAGIVNFSINRFNPKASI